MMENEGIKREWWRKVADVLTKDRSGESVGGDESVSSNGVGMAGFLWSLFGLVSFLAFITIPVGFVFSVMGLRKKPRKLAVGGVVISVVTALCPFFISYDNYYFYFVLLTIPVGLFFLAIVMGKEPKKPVVAGLVFSVVAALWHFFVGYGHYMVALAALVGLFFLVMRKGRDKLMNKTLVSSGEMIMSGLWLILVALVLYWLVEIWSLSMGVWVFGHVFVFDGLMLLLFGVGRIKMARKSRRPTSLSLIILVLLLLWLLWIIYRYLWKEIPFLIS
jgi:hypothetical protein